MAGAPGALRGWGGCGRGAASRRAVPSVPGVPEVVVWGRMWRNTVRVGLSLAVMAAAAAAVVGGGSGQAWAQGAGLVGGPALTSPAPAAAGDAGGGTSQTPWGRALPFSQAAPAPSMAVPPVVPTQPQQGGGVAGAPGGQSVDPDAETKKQTQALFDALMREKNPLTHDQEIEIKKQNEKTAHDRARIAPQFSSVMRNVPLDPSSEIPIVEMDLGQPTAISFIDMSGQRWPIEHCDWSGGFDGDKPVVGSHVLVLKTSSLVENGSVVCSLEGLTTPVRLRLSTGNHKHYIGFDARIPKNGPHAKPAPYDLGGASMVAGNDVMSGFLYGIPPTGAEEVDVAGGGSQTRAWRYDRAVDGKVDHALYVRTPMVLLSPGPKEEARREGVNVYKIAPLPDLTFDDDGHDVDVRIAGARVVRAMIPDDMKKNEEAPGPIVVIGDRQAGISGGQP